MIAYREAYVKGFAGKELVPGTGDNHDEGRERSPFPGIERCYSTISTFIALRLACSFLGT
jgi:hypothetical protein